MALLRKTFAGGVGLAFLILAGRLLPAADSPFTPEMQKRLDLLKTGYETFALNNSTIPYEKGLKTLNDRVKPVLERESAAAAQRTDLNTLARIKSDLERLGKNEVLTAAEEAPPQPLKHTYTAYKLELDKLESAQNASLADARRRYDKGLENVQTELTKAQEVEAALQIKQLRESLADTPAPTAASPLDPEPGAGGNLLANSTFKNSLQQWDLHTYERAVEATALVDKKVLFHDQPTLRVTNPGVTDTHISQKVKVKPNTRYRISGWIKTQDIKGDKGGYAAWKGARLCIAGKGAPSTSVVISDTWTEVSKEFASQDETEMLFECRLGYDSSEVSGTAWFSEVSLKEVTDATAQVKADL